LGRGGLYAEARLSQREIGVFLDLLAQKKSSRKLDWIVGCVVAPV
jgi:hypothetical protein